MSASAIKQTDRGEAMDTGDTCKVVVFYETSAARSGAMSVCERLVEQFAEDLDFEFRWWKFGRLADPALAQHAMEAAQAADIVLFCPDRVGLPVEAAEWLESWAEAGVTSTGAITLVIPDGTNSPGPVERLVATFRWAAQRLGMDFLNVTIPAPGKGQDTAIPEVPPPLAPAEPSHMYHWGLND